jgi:mono/diheme cytochrome c family protein
MALLTPFQGARRVSLLLLAACGAFCVFAATVDQSKIPPPAQQKVDFAKDIEPILSSHCYTCHGPKKQESSLRLDNKADALKGGENGRDIIPGKSIESVLIQAVSGAREDLKMPKKGERLTAAQVGLLRAWIDQGADWPADAVANRKDPRDHWAFKAPVRPQIPAAKISARARNPIDNFIFARLEKEKLKPSPEADRTTLLRRLSLDLIGLPPTIAEVDAFLADKRPDAYERQVERLLASPHYGERWGRHWLDAARYADSDGYEKDMSRNVSFYRDYVINSFNRDLAYDQFIIEQFAGDLLPNATQDQIVATGFLRNSMVNQEGAIDPEQFRMDAMFDRMDAIGKGVLGLTIQCAQCHNHKFDPFKQEEYYRMFAFLNNDYEESHVVYTLEEQLKTGTLKRRMHAIEDQLKQRTPDWPARMVAWEKEVALNQPRWTVLPIEYVGEHDEHYYTLKDGSILAAGYAPTKHTTTWRATNDLPRIAAFRLELLNDPSLPWHGPGRSFLGTCALSEFKVEAEDAANPTNKMKVKIARATADYANPKRELESNFYDKSTNSRFTGPVEFAIDGDDKTAWGIDAGPGRRNQPRKAVFVPEQPIAFSNGAVVTVRFMMNHGGWNSDDHMNNNLGRFRLSVTTETNAVADPLPARVREILATPSGERSPDQIAEVFTYWRTSVPEFKEANDEIEALWKEWPAGSTSLTLLSREEPRETHILKRGDWLKPADAVTPGVPAVLHPLPPNAPPTRLTFARWLADRKSPTTARVFVNRVWQAYFGIGLVSTAEDFGTQSEAPSHPELLDWLACEFMEPLTGGARPWSIKHLQRLIVTSSTYRQSSRVTPELYERDPYNRLLARGPRFRVEGEIVRDVALAASGLLNEQVGGRSTMPPAPAFLFQPPASYAPFPWNDETGPQKYRRALYTFRRRSTPYPVLQTFDVPNADASCVRRQRSNSPLQALVSLNEPIFVECAQALARKCIEEGGKTDAERVNYAFRRVLARPPAAPEKQELLSLLAKEKTRIADGWLNPNEIATGTNQPPAKLPTGATPAQLAAYTVISRVLLNLDETITKE